MKTFKPSKELAQKLKKIIDPCTKCGKCREACTVGLAFPAEGIISAVENGMINISLSYSCSMCSLCKKVCPEGIDLSECYLKIRQEIIMNKNPLNSVKGYYGVQFHQRNSFSRLFTAAANGGNGNVERVFLPGCSLSSANPEIVLRVYEFLNSKNADTAIILKCCGNPTHVMGQKFKFEAYYEMLLKEIEKVGAKEVITACPSCYTTLLTNSPEINTKMLWEILLEEELPEKNRMANDNIKLALHDPCQTRDFPIIHDQVRKILNKLGYEIEEFKNTREMTECCGSGGMISLTNPESAMKQMSKRAQEATADKIVTYCSSCAEALQRGGKASIHLLNLIFDTNGTANNIEAKTTLDGSYKKWLKRYKCRNAIRKLNRR